MSLPRSWPSKGKNRRLWHVRLSRHETQVGEHEVYDHERETYWLASTDREQEYQCARWDVSGTAA